MAYKISCKHLGFEKDTLIEIGANIVAVPNGGTVTLTQEQELAFFNKFGEYPDTWFDRHDKGIFKCTVTKAKAVSSDNFHGQPAVAAVEDDDDDTDDKKDGEDANKTDDKKGGEA